jgi:hypothetical protein
VCRHFCGVTTQSCGYLPVQSRDHIATQVKGEGSLTTNDGKASCLNERQGLDGQANVSMSEFGTFPTCPGRCRTSVLGGLADVS